MKIQIIQRMASISLISCWFGVDFNDLFGDLASISLICLWFGVDFIDFLLNWRRFHWFFCDLASISLIFFWFAVDSQWFLLFGSDPHWHVVMCVGSSWIRRGRWSFSIDPSKSSIFHDLNDLICTEEWLIFSVPSSIQGWPKLWISN